MLVVPGREMAKGPTKTAGRDSRSMVCGVKTGSGMMVTGRNVSVKRHARLARSRVRRRVTFEKVQKELVYGRIQGNGSRQGIALLRRKVVVETGLDGHFGFFPFRLERVFEGFVTPAVQKKVDRAPSSACGQPVARDGCPKGALSRRYHPPKTRESGRCFEGFCSGAPCCRGSRGRDRRAFVGHERVV